MFLYYWLFHRLHTETLKKKTFLIKILNFKFYAFLKVQRQRSQNINDHLIVRLRGYWQYHIALRIFGRTS